MPRGHEASPTMMEPPFSSVTRATTSKSPDTTTVTSQLELLPRELRNAIYEELWEATPYHDAPLDIKTGDSGAIIEQEWQERKLPLWLLASKTVLEEGLEELVHGSIWTIGTYHKKRHSVVMNPVTGKSESASWMNISGTLPDPTKKDEMVLWMGEDWLLDLSNMEHLGFRPEVFKFEVSCKCQPGETSSHGQS
ncbi:hypothetical protein E8E11_005387 [Didymella keratinophila]|nr:hypothetical protein E8E11_005387 [Didymella keratinophila]